MSARRGRVREAWKAGEEFSPGRESWGNGEKKMKSPGGTIDLIGLSRTHNVGRIQPPTI
jgi:hypothetical protein